MSSFLQAPAEPDVWQARPSRVVLQGVVGSRGVGLDTAESDTDRLGVFAESTDEFLGLDEPLETARHPHCDEQLFELRKYLSLALRSNSTILELLYLDRYEVCDEVGLGLIGLRDKLVSGPRVKGAYLGYAQRQVDDLRRGLGERAGKAARTAARIVKQGFELYSTGHLTVRVDAPGWYHDIAERAQAGDLSAVQGVVAQYDTLFAETRSVLPDEPDRAAVDAWLRKTRRALL